MSWALTNVTFLESENFEVYLIVIVKLYPTATGGQCAMVCKHQAK